jgi:hypothetical protein
VKAGGVTFDEFSAVDLAVGEFDCYYVTLGFVEQFDWDADCAHGFRGEGLRWLMVAEFEENAQGLLI